MTDIKNKTGVIKTNIQTSNGMLYKGAKVRVIEEYDTKLTVSDLAGRLFHINQSDISVN